MKRVFFAICVAVLALPLLAQQEDSPLVRAAKASGRVTKKAKVVITNDTLVRTGGHLATTDVTTPIKISPDYSSSGASAPPQSSAAASQPATPASNGTVSQPATATTYQPKTAQTSQVTTMTTASLPTATTAQPPLTTAQPVPQP